jgi:hypothetical protein
MRTGTHEETPNPADPKGAMTAPVPYWEPIASSMRTVVDPEEPSAP